LIIFQISSERPKNEKTIKHTRQVVQTPLGELNSEKGSKRRDFENTVSNVAFEIHNFWPHNPETWYGQGEGTLPP
jgi:hypothetical protein